MLHEKLLKIIEREILPFVQSPGRYAGNEENIIVKKWIPERTRIVLVYPDLYELGMSYTGFQILYHILNKYENLLAERCYAPWKDMEERLREKKIPLFSLESKHPLMEFDIIGFTLPYEMVYTNVLNILDMGGIPVHSKERNNSHPIIIAGGMGAFNPEPLHAFIDLFVIGDSEEIIGEISRFIGSLRRKGVNRREIILKTAQKFPGIYAPQFYHTGEQGLTPEKKSGLPGRIKALKIPELKKTYYPSSPLIPLIEVPHNRYSLEVMRGCSHGCRFCNAGFLYRPVRERAPEEVIISAKSVLQETGQNEISMLSLSTSDYTSLKQVTKRLKSFVIQNRLSLSLPSLRADKFDEEIAEIARTGRLSGLTFAPEAGTSRLRNVINKNLEEEDLYQAVRIALSYGWKRIKLYFMVGLPTEDEDDLNGIVDMVTRLIRLKKEFGPFDLHLTLSTFIPKPHTPFQWERQISPEETQKRIDLIVKQLPRKRVKINWRDPHYSEIEGILARGDREIAELIFSAWKMGARMDSWQEFYNQKAWDRSFNKLGLDPEKLTEEISINTPLPWSHIDTGIPESFFLEEREKAYSGETTEGCTDKCTRCGICDFKSLKIRLYKPEDGEETVPLSSSHASAATQFRYRLRYAKTGMAKYISHLDVQRVWYRVLRRSGLPIYFSRGFHPKPRIAPGLPLPLGYTSSAEHLDFWLTSETGSIAEALNPLLPEGFEIKTVSRIPSDTPSVQSSASGILYRIQVFSEDFPLKEFLMLSEKDSIMLKRFRKGKTTSIDGREFIKDIFIRKDTIYIHLIVKSGRTIRPDLLLKYCYPGELSFSCHREDIFFAGNKESIEKIQTNHEKERIENMSSEVNL